MGAGGVVVAMYVFRKAYHLEKYITEKHFEKMGRIVVLLALLYLYFNINEYLIPAFKMKKPEEAHLTQLFAGEYAALFWFAISVGMIIPIAMLVFKRGRRPLPVFIAGVMVVVGAWFQALPDCDTHPASPILAHAKCSRELPSLFPELGRMGHRNWLPVRCTTGDYLFARIYPIIPHS